MSKPPSTTCRIKAVAEEIEGYIDRNRLDLADTAICAFVKANSNLVMKLLCERLLAHEMIKAQRGSSTARILRTELSTLSA